MVGLVVGRDEASRAAIAGSAACVSRRYHLLAVIWLTPNAPAVAPCDSPASTQVTMECRVHVGGRAFLWKFKGALRCASGFHDNLSLQPLSLVNNLSSSPEKVDTELPE
jgi:hypothetical protein